MASYADLRKMLGLDDEVDRAKLDGMGLVPMPPDAAPSRDFAAEDAQQRYEAALGAQRRTPEYRAEERRRSEANTAAHMGKLNGLIDEARAANREDAGHAADESVLQAFRSRVGDGASSAIASLMETLKSSKDAPFSDVQPEFDQREQVSQFPSSAGSQMGRSAMMAAQVNAAQPVKPTPAPVSAGKGTAIADKAALVDAIDKVAVNPEQTADGDDSVERIGVIQPEVTKRRPLGVIGPAELPEKPTQQGPAPADEAAYRTELNDPTRRIFAQGQGGGGGALGEVSKMVMGSNDPRLSSLREALSKRSQLMAQADAEHEGGIGADIAGGTHFNTNAGAGTRARAEAILDEAQKPLQEQRAMGDFDTRQADSTQRRQLAISNEQRAQAQEGRAVAGEQRTQKAFDVKAATSDASSSVSRNARAEMEALYGDSWNKIPKEVRDSFSADDVDRFFREATKDKPMKGGGGLSTRQQMGDDKALTEFEKNMIQPGTVDAYNRIAGRLESDEPLISMGAGAKALQGALGAIPFAGKSLSENVGNMTRSLTPEGQQLYQDAIRVMQQITLDTTGKAMNEQELNNIKARLGMSVGDENAFRAALRNELDAAQKKADRQLAAQNPRVQQMAKERGIMPQWRARGGGARPYALETEGRFSEADAEANGAPPQARSESDARDEAGSMMRPPRPAASRGESVSERERKRREAAELEKLKGLGFSF